MVRKLVKPLAGCLDIENLILISPRGTELVHLIQDEDGDFQEVTENTGAANSPIVQPYLEHRDDEEPPRRALGVNLVNGNYYYFTAIPVPLGERFAGVVVIGTSIDNILPFLKSTALADIIIYGGGGESTGPALGGGRAGQHTPA